MSRLIDVKDFKVGSFIYGRPTGANNRSKTPVQFKVLGKGRKYVTLEAPVGRSDKYLASTGVTESSMRSGIGAPNGYEFYADLVSLTEDSIKERRAEVVWKSLRVLSPRVISDELAADLEPILLSHGVLIDE